MSKRGCCWIEEELRARRLQREHSTDPAIRRFAERRVASLSGGLAWRDQAMDNNENVNRPHEPCDYQNHTADGT